MFFHRYRFKPLQLLTDRIAQAQVIRSIETDIFALTMPQQFKELRHRHHCLIIDTNIPFYFEPVSYWIKMDVPSGRSRRSFKPYCLSFGPFYKIALGRLLYIIKQWEQLVGIQHHIIISYRLIHGIFNKTRQSFVSFPLFRELASDLITYSLFLIHHNGQSLTGFEQTFSSG